MKKLFIIMISLILAFIISFYIGIKISSANHQDIQEIAEVEEEQNSEVISSEEEKISPNAMFTLKKHYNECSHTKEEKDTIPTELVNMSQKELEEKYEGWKIEKFSKDEVILIKNEIGICREHYELKEKDGYIVVYNLDENGEENMYMTTNIPVEYLPETDKHALQKGIYLYGNQELNEMLQDFE